jgi:hypothetical protein
VAERPGRPRRRRGVPVPRPHRCPRSRAGVTHHGRRGRDGQHRDPNGPGPGSRPCRGGCGTRIPPPEGRSPG